MMRRFQHSDAQKTQIILENNINSYELGRECQYLCVNKFLDK